MLCFKSRIGTPPIKDWFKLIYEVVFGEENGPRIGFFISFFGLKETIELINDRIN